MRILIIEDEPFAQAELMRLLAKVEPEVKILDCLDTVEDSVDWLEANDSPDLIFMDIQLADGKSFEIFEQTKVSAPIIFTTAYDNYALEAFKVNTIGYLLKPVKEAELKAAMDKLKNMRSSLGGKAGDLLDEQKLEKLLKLSEKPEYKTRFIAKVGDRIESISLAEIAYFYAEDNEVFLVRADAKRFIIEYTLEQLGNLLDPKLFFRINRSFLIKIDSIAKVSKYFNSRLLLELKPKTEQETIISRAKVSAFLEWMDG